MHLNLRRPLLTLSLLLLPLLALPGLASASSTQSGAPMVIINPGGGVNANGSDGVQPVFNGSTSYTAGGGWNVPVDGSDQQYFANTSQWCCAGTSPMLNIGGTLYGAGGAAYSASSWDTVEVLSTSGSAVTVAAGGSTPATTPVGSGAATIRYTAVHGGRSYVMTRAISYRYPSPYYTESYTFQIPAGNTDVVKFYQGGDAAPGNSDAGTGVMTTSPKRTLYEVNPYSGIFVSYQEGTGAEGTFDFYFIGHYSAPWGTMQSGGDLPDTVNTGNHDAGIEMQWTLGSTPGTYTRNMNTIVNFQDVSLDVGFSDDQVNTGQSSTLQIQMVNTTTDPAVGVGYSYTLPAGLSKTGAESSDCGGTLNVTSTTISLSGVSLSPGQNCTVSFPVSGADGRYVINNQDFTAAGGLEKGYGSVALTIGTPTYDLTVTKTGSGAVSSSPAGIDCGVDCAETGLAVDSIINLTATPDSGQRFVRWTGDTGSCIVTSTTCQITMEQNVNIQAEFEAIPTYDLTVTKTGSGSVSSSPAGIDCGVDCAETGLAENASVTLTAAPSSGHRFVRWTGDIGACTTTSTTCALTMSQNRSVTAEFEAIPDYLLTVTKSGAGTGTVSSSPAGIDCGPDCSEEFQDDTSVTLTAADGTNSQFVKWTGDYGACTDTNPVCTVTMDQARTIDAEFLSTVRKLTVTKTGSGSGTVTSSAAGIDCGSTCEFDFPVNDVVTLTAASASGSSFIGFSGDCAGASTCQVTMDQARSVSAEFKKDSVKLTVEAPQNGSIVSDPQGIDCGSTCSFDFPAGSKVKLTAKPAAGYKFSSWEGACAGQGNPCEIDMSDAKSVKPVFVKLTPPKLEIKMTPGSSSVKPGQRLPVTVIVDNTGEETASDTEVCFTIPPGFAFSSATKPYVLKKGIVCWALGDIQGSEVQAAAAKSVKVNLKALKSVKSGTVNLRAAAAAENAEAGSEVTAKAKTKVKVKKAKKPRPKPVTG